MPARDKNGLLSVIGAMHAGGMTNLSGGWLAAADLLTRSETPGHDARIILLTDGQANQGVCDSEALRRQRSASAPTTMIRSSR
jgi:Ca-activated chloride channel family protein